MSRKKLLESEPAITSSNSKVSGLLRALDLIFTPLSMNRYFLRQKNYKDSATSEINMMLMKPVIYFAESGKLALYGGLITDVINNLN